VTDSSDPKAPKNSRKKRSREPATIDLKATVLDEGVQQNTGQDKAWDAVKPEETIVPDAGAPAEDTLGAEGTPGFQDTLATQDTLGSQDTLGTRDALGTRDSL